MTFLEYCAFLFAGIAVGAFLGWKVQLWYWRKGKDWIWGDEK